MGGRRGIAAIALLLGGCGGSEGTLAIRATPVPLSLQAQPVPERIAEARGQVALGNVALGLELFRKASREDPTSVEALAGMADCYGRMARFDLARRYLEQALALAPSDPGLLTALASTLDGQGRVEQARAVRAEVAERARTAASVATALATVGLPAAEPQMAVTADPASKIAETVTVALPPVRKAVAEGAASQPSLAAGPRLERMSLGEVALVTSGAARWQRDLAAQSRSRSGTVRTGDLRIVNVRLLNAARHRGLAARTRTMLQGSGWTRLSIGDSPRVRTQSLVLYSESNRLQARRLAAQIGIALAATARPGDITVLLGSDAVGRKTHRS